MREKIMNKVGQCPFCCIGMERAIAANEFAFAMFDGFPVSPGHMLIVPKRHIASLFDATEEERTAMFGLISAMREMLFKDRKPDGFNIGINDGDAAGQTVMHLHIHLIPRYDGDMPDPRGGIRWIFPDKAVYWSE